MLLEASELALTRFANNQVHQNVAQGARTLTVRARTGQRVGSARTARLDA